MKKDMIRLLAVASLTASLALFAGGCTKKTVRTDEGMSAAEGAAVESRQAGDRGVAMGAEESLTTDSRHAYAGTAAAAISEGRTSAPLLPVYFDFDKSNIRDDQMARINGNAAYLKDNHRVTIRIEGNCDERGTNEYNMALGERRAMTAKKYLMNMGIAESRLQTVSYGEEKPLVYGHDEHAWAQNRRDDFVIVK